MKTLKVEDITEQMLKELSKKSSMKEDKFLDELVSRMYMEMKRTGEESLVNSPRQDLLQVCIDTISVLKNIIQDLSDQNKRLTNEVSRLRGTNSNKLSS